MLLWRESSGGRSESSGENADRKGSGWIPACLLSVHGCLKESPKVAQLQVLAGCIEILRISLLFQTCYAKDWKHMQLALCTSHLFYFASALLFANSVPCYSSDPGLLHSCATDTDLFSKQVASGYQAEADVTAKLVPWILVFFLSSSLPVIQRVHSPGAPAWICNSP